MRRWFGRDVTPIVQKREEVSNVNTREIAHLLSHLSFESGVRLTVSDMEDKSEVLGVIKKATATKPELYEKFADAANKIFAHEQVPDWVYAHCES
ncbi:MAG: hypothetical protein M1504_02980 [Candidatus Marsarchaeota archaeon]|nr:hypothetical protein [Candidatus Marsarchaeota archaeon]